MKSNIIFFGTPEFAVPTLEALNVKHNVQLVICQPDKVNSRNNKIIFNPVKKYALDNGLEVFQPEDVNSLDSIEHLKKFDSDYYVVVAYGQIIKKEVRDLPKKNIINVHASLLPKYRGAAPIHRAIMDREDITGVSIMKVDKGLDKGAVYLTKDTKIENKKLSELHDELSCLGAEAILEYIEKDMESSLLGVVQDDELATYAEKISKEDGILDFENINIEIGKINGLYPRPGASFNYLGEKVKALNATVYSENPDTNAEISEIIDVDDSGIFINCGDGILLIDEIQFPGKKPMSVESFIKGNEIKKNVKLR